VGFFVAYFAACPYVAGNRLQGVRIYSYTADLHKSKARLASVLVQLCPMSEAVSDRPISAVFVPLI